MTLTLNIWAFGIVLVIVVVLTDGITVCFTVGLTWTIGVGFICATGVECTCAVEDLACEEVVLVLLDIIPDGEVTVPGIVVFGIDVDGIQVGTTEIRKK